MIHPTELRLGNLIASNHFPDKEVVMTIVELRATQAIVRSDNGTTSPMLYDNEMRGIRLTEPHFEGVNGLTIKWSFKGRAEISMCGIPITVIEYLHEWQNLYYLLFGNELEVKP
jgi:hypothetical protein